MWNSSHTSLLFFMYTDKMKAQTDENSMTQISLDTHSLLKDSFLNDSDLLRSVTLGFN